MKQEIREIAALLDTPVAEASVTEPAEKLPEETAANVTDTGDTPEDGLEATAESLTDDTDTGDDDPEGDDTGSDDDKPEGEEAELVNSLNDFAKELDVPVEDMYQLEVNMMGQDPKTIGELKDFYSANSDIEGLRANITEQREGVKQYEDAVKEIPVITNEYLQARAQVISIQDSYNRIDWSALRNENPGQYAALMKDYETAYAQAQNQEQTVAGKVEQNDKAQSDYQTQLLMNKVPEMKDKDFRNKAATAVVDMAGKYGFTPEDIGNITDSRLMHMLIDLSKSNQTIKTAEAKQKEKVVPISGRPSAGKHNSTGRKAALKKLTEKAQNSGDRRDQVNAINALLT